MPKFNIQDFEKSDQQIQRHKNQKVSWIRRLERFGVIWDL